MTQELLAMCNKDVKGAKQREGEDAVADLQTLAPLLYKLAPCSLIIPLQNSLTVTVPSAAQLKDIHKPFPLDPPTFHRIYFHSHLDIAYSTDTRLQNSSMT